MAVFDYVVIDDIKYKKTIGTFVIVLGLLITIMVPVIVSYKTNLEQLEVKEGIITEIRKTTRLRWNSPALYQKYRKVEYECVLIKIDNREFILDEKHITFWDEILTSLIVGDPVKLYYQISMNDDVLIEQLESNGEVIIPLEFGLNQTFIFGLVITGIILIIITFLIHLRTRRFKYLRNPSLF